MLRSYEIVLSGQRVALCESATAQMALIDHLRGAGCRDADIIRLGPHSVSWRGAVYRARAVPADTPEDRPPGDH